MNHYYQKMCTKHHTYLLRKQTLRQTPDGRAMESLVSTLKCRSYHVPHVHDDRAEPTKKMTTLNTNTTPSRILADLMLKANDCSSS